MGKNGGENERLAEAEMGTGRGRAARYFPLSVRQREISASKRSIFSALQAICKLANPESFRFCNCLYIAAFAFLK